MRIVLRYDKNENCSWTWYEWELFCVMIWMGHGWDLSSLLDLIWATGLARVAAIMANGGSLQGAQLFFNIKLFSTCLHWKLKTQSSMFIFVNWLPLKSKEEDICTRSNPAESFRLGGIAWRTCWGQTLHCKFQVHPGVIELFQRVLIMLKNNF